MILLFSGGLDSYIAWHYLGKPQTLYCDIGHRYVMQEKKAILNLIPQTFIDNRLELGDWEEEDANIPMRNAFLIMIASYYDNDIVLVVQKGEMDIPDRSLKFFSDMSKWLTFLRGDGVYKVSSPFFLMTKTDMVKWYVNKGLDTKALTRSVSCFSGKSLPCGKCGACFRRWVAFTNNGIEEKYTSPILKWEGVKKYVDKMKQGKYDAQRTDETFTALRIAGYKDV